MQPTKSKQQKESCSTLPLCSVTALASKLHKKHFITNRNFCLWYNKINSEGSGDHSVEEVPSFVHVIPEEEPYAPRSTSDNRGSNLPLRHRRAVRALAFHQCCLGTIPRLSVITGLSLLVLCSAPRGCSPGTPVFPSLPKPTFDLISLWLIWFSLPN